MSQNKVLGAFWRILALDSLMDQKINNNSIQVYLGFIEEQLQQTPIGSPERAEVITNLLDQARESKDQSLKAGLVALAIEYEPRAIHLLQAVPAHVHVLALQGDFKTAANLLRVSVELMTGRESQHKGAKHFVDLLRDWTIAIMPLAKDDPDVSQSLFDTMVKCRVPTELNPWEGRKLQ